MSIIPRDSMTVKNYIVRVTYIDQRIELHEYKNKKKSSCRP